MPGKPPPPSADSFHRERSKLLDGFARVEAALVRVIVRSGGKAKRDTLAGKIKAFREQRASTISEEMNSHLNRIQELNSLRTDIVHSTIGLIDQDGERFAVFSNASAAADRVQPATRLTYQAMREIADELAKAADLIERR
jgi:hypothetical protein